MELLFALAHWHALAKLRQHTDETLSILESQTIKLGKLLRKFKKNVCDVYDTRALDRDMVPRTSRTPAKDTTAGKAKTSSAKSGEYF